MNLVQPLKWHGGKYYLRQWIIGLMPPHLHYVEPFFGGGAVLLARQPIGVSEVINDLHGELTNFWRMLQCPEKFKEFQSRVDLIPFSEVEFDKALELQGQSTEDVDRAVQFFVLARQSRQGLMKDFATLSRNRTRGGINEQVNSWLSVIDGLPDVHRRLKSVVILNQDACDVIRKQDGSNTLFYCDPPYLHETRSSTGEYAHEMTVEQHKRLLATLASIEGKFMLSGYPSDLYSAWATKYQWKCHQQKIDNKASSSKVKEIKTECLWCNF